MGLQKKEKRNTGKIGTLIQKELCGEAHNEIRRYDDVVDVTIKD